MISTESTPLLSSSQVLDYSALQAPAPLAGAASLNTSPGDIVVRHVAGTDAGTGDVETGLLIAARDGRNANRQPFNELHYRITAQTTYQVLFASSILLNFSGSLISQFHFDYSHLIFYMCFFYAVCAMLIQTAIKNYIYNMQGRFHSRMQQVTFSLLAFSFLSVINYLIMYSSSLLGNMIANHFIETVPFFSLIISSCISVLYLIYKSERFFEFFLEPRSAMFERFRNRIRMHFHSIEGLTAEKKLRAPGYLEGKYNVENAIDEKLKELNKANVNIDKEKLITAIELELQDYLCYVKQSLMRNPIKVTDVTGITHFYDYTAFFDVTTGQYNFKGQDFNAAGTLVISISYKDPCTRGLIASISSGEECRDQIIAAIKAFTIKPTYEEEMASSPEPEAGPSDRASP